MPQAELVKLARERSVPYEPSNLHKDVESLVRSNNARLYDVRNLRTLPQYAVYKLVADRLEELKYIRRGGY